MHFADEIFYKRISVTEFVIRTSLAGNMTANTVLLLVLSIGLSFVTGDYSQEYDAAYVYPDQEHYYANTSALTHHASSGRTKYGDHANIKTKYYPRFFFSGGFSMMK